MNVLMLMKLHSARNKENSIGAKSDDGAWFYHEDGISFRFTFVESALTNNK